MQPQNNIIIYFVLKKHFSVIDRTPSGNRMITCPEGVLVLSSAFI